MDALLPPKKLRWLPVLLVLLLAAAPALGGHSLSVNRSVVGCGDGIEITVSGAATPGTHLYNLVVTAPPGLVQLRLSNPTGAGGAVTDPDNANNTTAIGTAQTNVTWLNATGSAFGFTINATNQSQITDASAANITATYDCRPRLTPNFPVNFNMTNGSFFLPPGAVLAGSPPGGAIPVNVTVAPNGSVSDIAGVFALLENQTGNVTASNTTLVNGGDTTFRGTISLTSGIADGNYSVVFIAKRANHADNDANNTTTNRSGVAVGSADGRFHIQVDRERPARPNLTGPNITFTGPPPGDLNIVREWKSWPDGSNNSSNTSAGSGIAEYRIIATTSATCDQSDAAALFGVRTVTDNASSVNFAIGAAQDNATLRFCVNYTRDRAGNVNDTGAFAISNITNTTFDFTPPEVNFTGILNGTQTDTRTFSFFANDRTSGVNTSNITAVLTGPVSGILTNATCTNATNAHGRNNSSCTITLGTGHPNGAYTLNIQVLDNVSLNNSTATRAFTIVPPPPTSPIVVQPSTGGGGGSSPATAPEPAAAVETQSILSISPFTPVTLAFPRTVLSEMSIETKSLAAAVSVTVTQHLSRPSNVAEPPAVAAVNKYISVDAKNIAPGDFSKVTLKFTVERAWLDRNNLSEGQVTLARHDDAEKEWQKFAAKLVKEEGGVLTFESTVPRLSVFAIIAEPAPPVPLPLPSPAATPAPGPETATATPPPAGTAPASPPPPATPPPVVSPVPPARSPGFEALGAVAALGAALAVISRRRPG